MYTSCFGYALHIVYTSTLQIINMKIIFSIGLILLLGCENKSSSTEAVAPTIEKSTPVSENDDFNLLQSLSNSSVVGSASNKILSTDTISENLFLTQYVSENRFLGTLIWTKERGKFNPIWQLKDSSDFPPHTFSFVDYNNDGRKDLTLLFGQEDVYGTDVYLNEASKTFSKDNFKLVHQNWNDYSVIVDLDGDGLPELLDSGNEQTEQVETPKFFLSDEVRKEVERKYDKIAQVKGANNFHFSMPNHFRVFNSFLMDSIKVMGFENGHFTDKTCRYNEYLDWRISLLKQMDKDSRNDKKTINGLISYLEKKKICN